MFCTKCGTPADNKRFCTRCGKALTASVYTVKTIPEVTPKTACLPVRVTAALAGQTLDERYCLEAGLGDGGMGSVYRARRLRMGDRVAVKILHPSQVSGSQAMERFRREAQTAARLNHPNVVQVYDFGVTRDGLTYLVMELAEGENLRRWIEMEGALDVRTAIEIVRQIALALDAAHRQGVVHRDIKPENILVRRTPAGVEVKLLDFGIAALGGAQSGRLTHTGDVVGTPHYMSPEQCLGEEVDGRADIYSLGAVLFEMLTGFPPFSAPAPIAVMVQQVNQLPPSLRSLNPNIAPALDRAVLRALQKQRELRPRTAGEFAAELMAAVQTPEKVRSNTTAPELARQSRPAAGSRSILRAVAALLLLALAAGGVRQYQRNHPSIVLATSREEISSPLVAPSPVPSPEASPTEVQHHWQVIPSETLNVADAANAAGEADQNMAAIGAGGQLALEYRAGQLFGNGQGGDLRLTGPQQTAGSYLVFVRNDSAGDWRRIDINRRGLPQGVAEHDMGHHDIAEARQVMIRNIGKTELNIDAVTALYKDSVPREPIAHTHSAPEHRRLHKKSKK